MFHSSLVMVKPAHHFLVLPSQLFYSSNIIFLIFSLGQSSLLIMDSEGNIAIYSLPELKLIYKENCVDAADAV